MYIASYIAIFSKIKIVDNLINTQLLRANSKDKRCIVKAKIQKYGLFLSNQDTTVNIDWIIALLFTICPMVIFNR